MNSKDLKGVFFVEILKKLIKLDAQIGIIAPQWGDAEKFEWDASDYTFKLKRKFLSERQPFLSKLITLTMFYLKVLWIIVKIRGELKDYQTVVFCFGFPSGLISLTFKNKRYRKIIWWMGTDYFLLEKFNKFYLWLLGSKLQHASAGLYIKNGLSKFAPRDVLHLPIDGIVISHQPIKKVLVGKKTINLLAVGRLEPIKQFDELIHSFKQLDNKKYKLTIIGDGSERSKLIKMIGNATNIDLVGALPRKKTLFRMKNCDFLIITSKTEGLPTVFFEALSYGKQCICTNVGDVGIWCKKHSEVGAVIDEISPTQIMNGIEKLQRVEKLKLQQAVDLILQDYNYDKTIKAILNAK